MKNSTRQSYSQLFVLRTAFEYELNRIKVCEDRQEYFRVINYFEQRICELKEEEAECLRIQTS